MTNLPTITLDTTLADLYRRASPKNAHKRIAQVLCGVNSASELSANVPRNAKYLYQDSPFNSISTNKNAGSHVGDKKQQQELAVKYLSLIPQRDAFISGDTAVVLFNIDETDEQKAHDKEEAEKTISVLAKKQRPDLIFCPGPSKIPITEARIDLIAYKLVLDGLEDYNLVVPPETHWFLNSKAALAQSGLPTPKSKIVELDGFAAQNTMCCTLCKGDVAEFVIPEACSGSRGEWFEKQSKEIFAELKAHPLPFVLKNQQTFGGAGTYIINTEEDRDSVIQDFRNGILRKLLSSVIESNFHLRPAALILSDLVENPIGDYGLTFFVTDDGSDPIFLAASEQMIDDEKAWIGSTINYARQDELKKKFGPLVKRIAIWLRNHDYVGPAGADVLETAPVTNGKTNGHHTNGTKNGGEDFSCFHVVDLNIRTSGSLCLPLLQGHFMSCGLWSGSSFSISLKKGRSEFIDNFKEEFESGQMCIISWYEDPDTGVSLADVAVGAEDQEGLKKAMKLVRDATDEVTF
ncbi:solid-state culture specific [Colletotrichum karsti]|uniref:Solid-state culture specific n=1 Tax=Colletotrichum karsti TaxID=1095194 RepID=A0A9P6I2Y2_9PEZI|nr:solid-state culture specific [Colletotrichum karsti]KAF9870970.1 solid-state culture specific [Colletotrichum karsti]